MVMEMFPNLLKTDHISGLGDAATCSRPHLKPLQQAWRRPISHLGNSACRAAPALVALACQLPDAPALNYAEAATAVKRGHHGIDRPREGDLCFGADAGDHRLQSVRPLLR